MGDLKSCLRCQLQQPLDTFPWADKAKGVRGSYCHSCALEHGRNVRAQRKENGKAHAYYLQRREDHRWEVIERTYGLNRDAYQALYDRQGGVCAICKRPETATMGKSGTLRSLAVDHDHNSGAVRGLLCTSCNSGIGQLGDDPERLRAALTYLVGG